MAIRIQYRSADDNLTERVISEEVPEPPNAVQAFCHLRNEERTFVLSRIEKAVDIETGEVISDIWMHYGLPSLKPPRLQSPAFPERRIRLSAEEAQKLRSTDKQKLFGRFQVDVLANAKRHQLRALFDGRCYRCGSLEYLELDHHVPQSLGGRLVPGNVVLLCRRCNLAKGEHAPSDYYSADELNQLEPIFAAQLALFDFRFNWTRWKNHPKDYLVSLGVDEAEAEAFINSREDGISVSLSVKLRDPE